MRNFQAILSRINPRRLWRGRIPPFRPDRSGASALMARPQAKPASASGPTTELAQHNPVEWIVVDEAKQVRELFSQFRSFMYQANQKTKITSASPPKALWEAGRLAGERVYFFLQMWNERGYLFEESQRGWIVSRAEKIALREQFMRERSAWDFIILYRSKEDPQMIRLSSELLGSELVSLRLYEDFVAKVLFNETG